MQADCADKLKWIAQIRLSPRMILPMKPLHLDFCHIPPRMPKTENFFYKLLAKQFDVRLVDWPDLLIYSAQGSNRHRLYTCKKAYYSFEKYQPDFRQCDFAFTCNYLDDPRHYRLPIYVHYCKGGAESIVKRHDDLRQIMAQKTKFCALVTGNTRTPTTRTRTEFFHRLCNYKKVDSGGTALNNLGYQVPWGGKLDFLKPYKFCSAFENESPPGYTTEKLFEAMQARCVPLYWGNSRVHEEFNPASFLNYSDFPSEEAFIEKIIELDRDDDKYFEYLQQPYFYNDTPSEFFNEAKLLSFFEDLMASPIRPVSQRKSFFFGRWLLVKKNSLSQQFGRDNNTSLTPLTDSKSTRPGGT